MMALRKSTLRPRASEQVPFFHDLQQHVVRFGMGLLDLVEDDDRVRPAADALRSAGRRRRSRRSPGGAPTSRLTVWRSMNSDMSIWTSASSLPNMNSASALVSSVLPTPVGPRKMNEPIGRLGSFRPARARRTALEIASMASSCPTMRSCSASSICSRRSDSSWAICVTGMPVHIETTSAMSSAVTCGLSSLRSQPARNWLQLLFQLRLARQQLLGVVEARFFHRLGVRLAGRP